MTGLALANIPMKLSMVPGSESQPQRRGWGLAQQRAEDSMSATMPISRGPLPWLPTPHTSAGAAG